MTATVPKNRLLFNICQELGECYAALGDAQAAALNFSEAQALFPFSPRPYTGLARAAGLEGRWEQAQTYFFKALELQPESDEAVSGLGTALLQTGRKVAAWDAFHQALEINPDNQEGLLGLARAAEEPEQLSLASERLERYLATHLVDFPVLFSLAELLARQGKISEAREALGKVLLFQPDHREGLALKEKLDRPVGEAAPGAGDGQEGG
jgi:tetratricopeptide (TPR) repeat protein